MTEAYIIDSCRTPRGIGKVGKGALADLHPQRLGAAVLKALAERNSLNTADVDDIIWGTSSQRGKQGGDMGRMAALDAGYDVKASGVTLDRYCGSGITAVNLAAAQIMSGMEDLVIAGGCEMMSYTASSAPKPDPEAGPMLMDSGNLHLRAQHPQSHQGICADAIATLEGISREALDDLALVSQQRADYAIRIPATKRLKQDSTGGLISGPALQTNEDLDNAALIDTFHTGLRGNEVVFGEKGRPGDISVCLGTAPVPPPDATFVTWTLADDSPFYCVEPWMGPANAAEHKVGLQYVAPGETQKFAVSVAVK